MICLSLVKIALGGRFFEFGMFWKNEGYVSIAVI